MSFSSFEVKNCPSTRLDRWLRREFPFLTQGLIEKLLREKKIVVNGNKAKSSSHVEEGMTVSIQSFFLERKNEPSPTPTQPDTPKKEDAEFLKGMIVWEDEEILILNKPSGLATQGGTGTKQHVDKLLKAYQYYFDTQTRYRLVHRLDKDTSGVLVIAKTLKSAHFLADAFKNGAVEKTYWAVTNGKPKQQTGLIDAPLIKATQRTKDELMVVDLKKGKPSKTKYRLIKFMPPLSWIEFIPKTGRTHQIRVHSAYIHCPILGDGKYGSHDEKRVPLHLHARKLKIPSMDGGSLTFVAEPPSHMLNTFKRNQIDYEKYV